MCVKRALPRPSPGLLRSPTSPREERGEVTKALPQSLRRADIRHEAIEFVAQPGAFARQGFG
jgi:hypothetical protein